MADVKKAAVEETKVIVVTNKKFAESDKMFRDCCEFANIGFRQLFQFASHRCFLACVESLSCFIY